MDKVRVKTIQMLLIGLWGVVVFNLPINVMLKTATILISTISFCYFFEYVAKTKHRIKNYPRFILLFYVPSFIMMGLHLLLLYTPFNIYTFIILTIVFLSLIYILVKRNLYLPYFIIISDVSFSKARKLSHQISEQRRMVTLSYVYRVLMIVSGLALLQVIQMLPMRAIGFNLTFIIPFVLLPSYIQLCKSLNVAGNDEAKGKFSIVSLLLSILLIVLSLFSDVSLLYKGGINVDTLVEDESAEQYKIGIVKEDYEDLVVKVKKGTPTKLEEKVLKEIEFKLVPVKYNVFFVDSISDKSGEEEYLLGLTLMQEDRAVSYVCVEKENDTEMLKYVVYHEYCHVLLNYYNDLETLQDQYQTFDSDYYLNNYRDEEELSKYYVTPYASENAIEDMCEIFAMYKTNPDYIYTNKVYEKKLTLLMDYFLNKYGVRF